MNELLFFLTILLDFSMLILVYRWLGKTGIFSWITFATLLANIQVMKNVELFGFSATLGNVAYASIYLATDILSENHEKRDAFNAVRLGFAVSVAASLLMGLTLAFTPASSDIAQTSLKSIFTFFPRIALASFVAYAVSQHFDIWCYHLWKSRLPSLKWLWLRNNFSTMLSQFIDTLIFTTTAFWGIYDTGTFISILGTTFMLKFITSLLDTPFLYLVTLRRKPLQNHG